MKRINHYFRSIFGVSTAEANGVMILIPLIIILITSPYIYQYYNLGDQIVLNHSEMNRIMAEMDKDVKAKEDSLEKLYLDKQRYYANTSKKHSSSSKKISFDKVVSSTSKKYRKNQLEPFDLNVADSIQLKSVYGIGPVLANRIIKYRDLLGGYISKNQLNEVYGLQDSVIMALDSLTYIDSSFQPVIVNINSTQEYELKRHPYFSWKEAKAISAYRYQHGNFHSADDLKKIHLLDSNKINKLLPYIAF